MPSLLEQIGGLTGLTGAAASAYLPYEESGEQIDYLKSRVPQYTQTAEDITNRAVEAAQFTPFAVTTGSGQTQVGEGGAITQTLGQPQQALQSGLLGMATQGMGTTVDPTQYQNLSSQALGGAQAALAQPTATAADIYSQMQAAGAGEQERQRMALENRLAAQGRLGVGTAAYGGTPEALAMEKAFAEQQANNWLQSQTMAQQLAAGQQSQAANLFGLGSTAALSPYQQQAANLQNISGALGASYIPEQQQLAALQAASPFSQLATSAALSQAEQLSSGGQYGLEAMVAGDQTIGSLEAARTQALAKTLSGLFGTSSSGESTVTSLLRNIFE
jgi:hypothetical protein